MAENVKKLIQESFIVVSNSSTSSETVKLVVRNIKHKFDINGENVWYDVHVVSQVF